MRKFLFLVSLLSFQSAFSADATDQLIQKFQTRMKVLDREMVTFRYEARTKTGFNTPEDIRVRMSDWTDRFYRPSVLTSDMAGPGTYVAVDPYASRSYGGENPQLYVLTIKKGARAINLDDGFSTEETNLIKELHQQLQCQDQSGQMIPEDRMDYFSLRQSGTLACREVAIKIATALKIQAIVYGYSASNSLAGCRSRHVAVNVVSSEAFDYAKTLFYSSELAIAGIDYGRFVKRAYEEAAEDPNLAYNTGNVTPMPAQLAQQTSVVQNDYLRWRNAKIYSCGPRWSIEGEGSILLDILTANLKKNYRDAETDALLVSLKNAFVAKAGPAIPFQIANLVALTKLSFQASGLPQDEATYNRWAFLTEHRNEKSEYKDELRKLYGVPKLTEDLGDNRKELETLIKKMSKKQKESPDLFFRLMAHYGFKGGYVAVSQNEFTPYLGGAVILSSMDPRKSFAQNLEISKRNYKAVIKQCIALYSDPNQSYEDIKKTDCSIEKGP